MNHGRRSQSRFAVRVIELAGDGSPGRPPFPCQGCGVPQPNNQGGAATPPGMTLAGSPHRGDRLLDRDGSRN